MTRRLRRNGLRGSPSPVTGSPLQIWGEGNHEIAKMCRNVKILMLLVKVYDDGGDGGDSNDNGQWKSTSSQIIQQEALKCFMHVIN